MSKVTQEEIQKHKTTLLWVKITNWLIDYPSLKNNALFKVTFRALFEFYKDELSEVTEEGNCLYKELDEIVEQLDENQREIKNIFGEIHEETFLLFKKIYEDEEEEEKKLKNILIDVIKLSKAFLKIWMEKQK